MNNREQTATDIVVQNMIAIQSVLDGLKKDYADDKHGNVVLSIVTALKHRLINISYNGSVFIQCCGKNNTSFNSFMIHYFPDLIDDGSASFNPFCVQVFFPTFKVFEVRTLEELLALLTKY